MRLQLSPASAAGAATVVDAGAPQVIEGEPPQRRVDLGVFVVDEQVVQAVAGEHVLPQRHGTVLVDDHGGVAAYLLEPLAELLGVADGRRQRREAYGLGEVDDDLLPDRAAEPVGEVVDLVHDDVGEPRKGR